MLIHDTVATTGRERTPEGFLRVKARIARAELHAYRAAELGTPPGFAPNDTIQVYRPPEQVFDEASMASFAEKPVTDGHPPGMVDAQNWKRFAIGHSGPEVTTDGDHLSADLLITDADAVRRAETGAQLSNGYHADFDFTPGTTPEREPYHAVQTNIRGNHIALVDAGRCGDTCRIGDATPPGRPVRDCGCGTNPPALTTVTIDGIAIETTTVGAEALARLRAAFDARDGTVAALTAQEPDTAGLDALVEQRTAAIDAARAALGPGFPTAGKSTDAIRRAVVAHWLSADLGERSDSYVAAAFDTLIATRPAGNPLATQLASAARAGAGSREAARQNHERFLTHAWKGDPSHGVL